MFVQAYIGGNDYISVIDNKICKVFDRSGRVDKENTPITPSILNGKSLYKAISILSSSNTVEIALFDEGDVRKYKGTSDTVFSLMKTGGFIRRLQTKGVHGGVKYTQMIFLYSVDKDLNDILRKAV